MLANRISRAFSRLTRPRINQHKDIFHLMRDNQPEIALIQKANQSIFNMNKDFTIQEQLQQNLGISKQASAEVSQLTLTATAYSPSMTPIQLKQKLSGKLEVDDVLADKIEGRYRPGHANLKFHYSINQDLPLIPQYSPNSTRAYIFKLPEGITEKQIMIELGHRYVESVKIQYSMIGVPAYAVIEFNSQNYLTDRAMQQEAQVSLNDQSYSLATESDMEKLKLTSRQLVLQGLQSGQTPATMLRFLSSFGHVMHLDLPMEIYREQSMDQIKELYAKENQIIRINFHKQDGTIQSEYYPPFEAQRDQDFPYNKHQQYKKRLRYCQNIDVYEGKQGQITMRPKGFCTVTFSCQEEAQNCYFHLRNSMKVHLKNGREDFQFDTKHREAILRHIDNQYIDHCLKKNPSSNIQNFNKKLDSLVFQSFYINLVYEQNKRNMYENGTTMVASQTDDKTSFYTYHQYRKTIHNFKESIGKDSFQDEKVQNQYGKSFDELAEQELYGAKLNKNKYKRYEVNIDDYLRTDPEQIYDEDYLRKIRKGLKNLDHPRREVQEVSSFKDDESEEEQFDFKDDEEEELEQEQLEAQQIQDMDERPENKKKTQKQQYNHTYLGKRSFSNIRQQPKTIPKTLQQKVRSHMKYNQFVRNTINEYMGVFSAQKLQRQFGRMKPTFSNPQNLRFLNGTDFLPESDVKKALQSSAVPCQQVYNNFVKTNEIIKSLNIDVEETILRKLESNNGNSLQNLTDVGRVAEEYEFNGQNIHEVVDQMNRTEAEIGYQFRAVINEETGEQKIAKIVKLEEIIPLRSIQKSSKYLQELQKHSNNDYSDMQKYFNDIMNGKPLSEEVAKKFNLQPGTIVDVQSVLHELSSQIGVPIKDFEKMMNMQNYSEEQLNNDMVRQMQISKIRRRKAAKKAVDYNRDPADIRVRGEDGKFVPSKFRQM